MALSLVDSARRMNIEFGDLVVAVFLVYLLEDGFSITIDEVCEYSSVGLYNHIVLRFSGGSTRFSHCRGLRLNCKGDIYHYTRAEAWV